MSEAQRKGTGAYGQLTPFAPGCAPGPGIAPRRFASTGETMREALARLDITEPALRWRLREWGEEAALSSAKRGANRPKVVKLRGTEPRYIPTLPAVKKRVTIQTNGSEALPLISGVAIPPQRYANEGPIIKTLRLAQDGHFFKVAGNSTSHIYKAARALGVKIETRKLGPCEYGVWVRRALRADPPPSDA